MNKEKKKKMFILVAIVAVAIIGIMVGIIYNVTRQTSTNVAKQNQNQNENQQEEPLVVPETSKEEETQEPEENVPTEEPEEEPKEEKPTSNDIPYYIKINNKANVVTIYKKDKNGNYTIPYKAMICSIGKATPAAGNVYTIPGGTWDRWTWGQMVGGVWAQYYTRIKGSILFHSVPYTAKDKSTLEYWEYDKLGTKASAGCIRLTVEDAKWIYDNCKPGTKVEFYESTDPGPLGKPTAAIISNEAEYVRGWDPTDPDSRNPWKTYTPSEEEPQEPSEENNQNSNTNNNNNTNTGDNNEQLEQEDNNQTNTETPSTGTDEGTENEEEKPTTKPDQQPEPTIPPEQDESNKDEEEPKEDEEEKDTEEPPETPETGEEEQKDTQQTEEI